MHPSSDQQTQRSDGRAVDEIRSVEVVPNFVHAADGSVLYSCGRTRVICTANFLNGVPPWIDDGVGWVTAEYSMLPYSTSPRKPRPKDGRIDGRSQEIQRLVGRSLRAAVDRQLIPGRTIHIDCDVLDADGGTRTASICGATLALGLAVHKALSDGRLAEDPRIGHVLATSAGVVGNSALLDLDYSEDSRAAIDLNLVGTAEGELVEVQGSSESTPLAADTWSELIRLGTVGLQQLGESLQQWSVPLRC